MIALLKFLDGPWETARGYLREDLDHIEAAFNQRWAATFGDDNIIKSSVVSTTTITGLGLTSVAKVAARVSMRI